MQERLRQTKMANQPISKRQMRSQDHELWERNRMQIGGALKPDQNLEVFQEEEEEQRVALMVHDIKPPFLDGRIVFTKQVQPVSIVKDPTSDFVQISKKGSNILKHIREQNDRKAMREKFWDLQGSNLGNLLKVANSKQDDIEAAKLLESGEIDYKGSNQFGSILKDQQKAVSSFALQKTIKQQREYLPIFSVRDELLTVINDNRIVIIVGETGSGKSTQLTQYLFESGFGKLGVIGCTQPRRVAAVSVAKRVADEMGVELGAQVGYSIRFEDQTNRETRIKYMTDGVLLRESLNDPELDNYSAIIMDEAHERSLYTDLLFGILKKISARRRDLKLIITSATMNAQKFADFFGGVPIFNIPGRTFPVSMFFSKHTPEDYVEEAVQQALKIHFQPKDGDILIFMTGQEDVEATCFLIQDRLEKAESTIPLIVLPIYS